MGRLDVDAARELGVLDEILQQDEESDLRSDGDEEHILIARAWRRGMLRAERRLRTRIQPLSYAPELSIRIHEDEDGCTWAEPRPGHMWVQR